jgi:hypothetical protein
MGEEYQRKMREKAEHKARELENGNGNEQDGKNIAI